MTTRIFFCHVRICVRESGSASAANVKHSKVFAKTEGYSSFIHLEKKADHL